MQNCDTILEHIVMKYQIGFSRPKAFFGFQAEKGFFFY